MNGANGTGRWREIAIEAFGSLLLVLAVFSLFLVLLYLVFPSGTPLRELVQTPVVGDEKYPWSEVEATLSSLQHDVRFRRGNSVAWGGASRGLKLYSHDAVQTLDDSEAKISFGPKDKLTLGSNSLIVVTRLGESDETGQKSYRVQVDGDLRGNLSAERQVQMEFDAAGHVARIAPGAANFRVSQNGRESSGLAVYSGEAQLAGRNGIIRVPAHYGVLLKKGVAVGPLVRLPAAPQLKGADGSVYRYRLVPPKVAFAWSAPAPEYHIQVATDPAFKNCVVDDKVRSPGYATGTLDKGRYFWRVSGVRAGLEGMFSRAGRFQLQQVLDQPPLKVQFPPDGSLPGTHLLTGSCDPAARIFIDGAEVARKTPGKFEREIRLKPGVNLIRVEALDPTGNASYASRIVYAREGGTGANALQK
jgi:hypothetical protein